MVHASSTVNTTKIQKSSKIAISILQHIATINIEEMINAKQFHKTMNLYIRRR
jgi:subtilase family serine protease